MWYGRRMVIFLVIECGESFGYRNYLTNTTYPQIKNDYKFELKGFSEFKFEEIMTCITKSLYLCDELFLLIKITFLLVIFELFIEPFLRLSVQAIYLFYKRRRIVKAAAFDFTNEEL